MRLATIITVATTQTLQDNLQNLGVFAATVSGDINNIHGEFDKNCTPLIARGTTIDNPIGVFFDATTSNSISSINMKITSIGDSLESPTKTS
jgi:hypothetical protein